MYLNEMIEKMKFDKRLTQFNLNEGNLTVEELNEHLNNLKDVRDQAVELVLSNDSDEEFDKFSSFEQQQSNYSLNTPVNEFQTNVASDNSTLDSFIEDEDEDDDDSGGSRDHFSL